MTQHYTIRGGIDSTAVYKGEDIEGEGPDNWTSGATHFGLTQSITPTASRNLQRLRGLKGQLAESNDEATARDTQKTVAGKTDLSVSVEYQPQDFEFLEYVMGSVSETNGTRYYPQESANDYSDKRKYDKLPSFSIAEKFQFDGDNDSENSVLEFLGLKVNTFEVSAAIGEPISISLDSMGTDFRIHQNETIETDFPDVPLKSEDVYHFVDSEVEIGANPIENILEGFTLSIDNMTEGLGDIRLYGNARVISLGRNIGVTIETNFENMTWVKNMMGASDGEKLKKPSLIDTINIKLDRGTGENLTCVLKDLRMDDPLPSTSYGEVTKQSLNLIAKYAYFIENE